MYKWEIQHAFDDFSPAPFAIHEIIGCEREKQRDGHILKPSDAFLDMVRAGGQGNFNITADVLEFTPTSSSKFKQQERSVVLGRRLSTLSFGADSDSDDAQTCKQLVTLDMMMSGKG